MTRRLCWAALCGLLIAGGRAALCAEPAVSDRLEVRVLNLDVVVTDRRQRPITGLAAGDFEVSIDGRPVELANFLEVDEPEVDERAPRTAGASAAAGEPLRYLAVYVANTNVERQERDRVLAHVRRYLAEAVGPRDRVLVASGERHDVAVRQGFVSDPELVERALAAIEASAAHGRRGDEYTAILREIQRTRTLSAFFTQQGAARGRAQVVLARIRAYAAEAHEEVTRTCAHLTRLVESMAGLPGRKALLFVGSGLALNPGESLFNATKDALGGNALDDGEGDPTSDFPIGLSLTGEDRVGQLARRASERGVALYALDVSGHRQPLALGASRSSGEAAAGSAPAREDLLSPGLGFSDRVEEQGSLRHLARETGGFALVNSQGYDAALERLGRDFRSYYSLGVAPPEGEAAAHAIEVRVRRKGARARYRRTARTREADEEAADRTRSALLAADGANPLGVRLEAGEAHLLEGGRVEVPLSIRIPLAGLAVRADGAAHSGQVSIFVAAAGDELAAVAVRKAELPVTIPNEQILTALGQVVDYRLDLRLEGRRPRVAVGVRDDLDAGVSTVTLELPAPAPEVEAGDSAAAPTPAAPGAAGTAPPEVVPR